MQVAMDPVPGDRAGVAQWLQHRTDAPIVQPVQSFESTLRQLQVRHRLLCDSLGCDHRRLEVRKRRVEVRRDGSHSTTGADHIFERQLPVEPRLHVVDVPIPSIHSAGQV